MNFYFCPEACGLTIVAELGEYDYSWNMLVVFRDNATRRLFWLEDGGCSCSSFGDNDHYNGPDDTSMHELVRTLPQTWAECLRAVDDFDAYGTTSPEQKARFIRTVSDAFYFTSRV